MSQTHFFIAVPLSVPTKEFLREKQRILKDTLPFKSWVHPEDLHITLSFLGYAKEDQLQSLKKRLPDVVHTHHPFNIRLTRLGTFGKKESPRILWYGLEESIELRLLQRDVANACEQAGFELEKRKYSPHITLARRWKETGKEFLINDSTSDEEIKEETVDGIVMYQTHLDRSPKYEVVDHFPFK